MDVNEELRETITLARQVALSLGNQGENLVNTHDDVVRVTETTQDARNITRRMDSYRYWLWYWIKDVAKSLTEPVRIRISPATTASAEPVEPTPKQLDYRVSVALRGGVESGVRVSPKHEHLLNELLEVSTNIGDELDRQNKVLEITAAGVDKSDAHLDEVAGRTRKLI
jgi:hypothetical protein